MGYWVRGQTLPPYLLPQNASIHYRSLKTSQQPPEGYPPQETAKPRYEPAPLLNPCMAQTEKTPPLKGVELYGMVALHTLAFWQG